MEKVSLVDHVRELRQRLIYCLIVMAVIAGMSWFYVDDILAFLIAPLQVAMIDTGGTDRMIMTSLTEGFITRMKVTLFTAFFISIPFILYQIWAFTAPGLYKKEKRIIVPFIVISPLMFLAGAAFVYYLVIPNAWTFFLGFQTGAIETSLAVQSEIRLSAYLNLMMSFLTAFGLVFQWPVLLVFLGLVGVVSVPFLQKWRRIVIVLSFVMAAFLTPPDVISQIALALPMIVFYELALLILKIMKKGEAA